MTGPMIPSVLLRLPVAVSTRNSDKYGSIKKLGWQIRGREGQKEGQGEGRAGVRGRGEEGDGGRGRGGEEGGSEAKKLDNLNLTFLAS